MSNMTCEHGHHRFFRHTSDRGTEDLESGSDKVSKHTSIACRQQANFVGMEDKRQGNLRRRIRSLRRKSHKEKKQGKNSGGKTKEGKTVLHTEA